MPACSKLKLNEIHGMLIQIILGAVAWRGCGRVTGNKESTKHAWPNIEHITTLKNILEYIYLYKARAL